MGYKGANPCYTCNVKTSFSSQLWDIKCVFIGGVYDTVTGFSSQLWDIKVNKLYRSISIVAVLAPNYGI